MAEDKEKGVENDQGSKPHEAYPPDELSDADVENVAGGILDVGRPSQFKTCDV
jgi:hypothetical protein